MKKLSIFIFVLVILGCNNPTGSVSIKSIMNSNEWSLSFLNKKGIVFANIDGFEDIAGKEIKFINLKFEGNPKMGRIDVLSGYGRTEEAAINQKNHSLLGYGYIEEQEGRLLVRDVTYDLLLIFDNPRNSELGGVVTISTTGASGRFKCYEL